MNGQAPQLNETKIRRLTIRTLKRAVWQEKEQEDPRPNQTRVRRRARKMKQYDFHPVAEIFPLMEPEELKELAEDIQTNGLREPIVLYEGKVLDGRNRLLACQQVSVKPRFEKYADNSPLSYVVSLNLKRRHLTPSQRATCAVEALPMLEHEARKRMQAGGKLEVRQGVEKIPHPEIGKSRDQAGKLFGVSGKYVQAAKNLQEKDIKIFNAVKAGTITIPEAASEIKKKERDRKRQVVIKKMPLPDKRIIVGDFREHTDEIADGSLSLIFTDPPYNRETLKIFPDLARFASDKLAEGGSLLCYVGQIQLPDALNIFRECLRYWWTVCCLHSGSHSLMREYGIRVGWKPILWFVKGTRHDPTIIVQDVTSGGQEKKEHDWQQAESEAAYWIEHLTAKDDTVCDPCLGSGTTAIAAEALGRRWFGFELDKDTARLASARLASVPSGRC